MADATQSQPLLICGKTAQIAKGVKAGLMPEYEVIHVMFTPDVASHDIPYFLPSKFTPNMSLPPAPPSSVEGAETERVGTGNFARAPIAIVLGGGYDDEHVQQIRAACGLDTNLESGIRESVKEGEGIPWLRPDMSIPAPPLGPEYGKHMVARGKECLSKLMAEGVMGKDGVWYY